MLMFFLKAFITVVVKTADQVGLFLKKSERYFFYFATKSKVKI